MDELITPLQEKTGLRAGQIKQVIDGVGDDMRDTLLRRLSDEVAGYRNGDDDGGDGGGGEGGGLLDKARTCSGSDAWRQPAADLQTGSARSGPDSGLGPFLLAADTDCRRFLHS